MIHKLLFQHPNKLPLHFSINIPVPAESFASLSMAGKRSNKVGILHFFIDIPDKCSPYHMAGCYSVDWNLLFCTSQRIKYSYHSCNFTKFKNCFNVVYFEFERLVLLTYSWYLCNVHLRTLYCRDLESEISCLSCKRLRNTISPGLYVLTQIFLQFGKFIYQGRSARRASFLFSYDFFRFNLAPIIN